MEVEYAKNKVVKSNLMFTVKRINSVGVVCMHTILKKYLIIMKVRFDGKLLKIFMCVTTLQFGFRKAYYF